MNEVTRLLHEWYKHPEYGIAAMLDQVGRKRFGGDEDPKPQMPELYNDVDFEELAAELDPPIVPALVGYAEGEFSAEADNKLHQIAQSYIFSTAYITRDMAAKDAARDGGYVLRAVKMSLTRYNSQKLSGDYRELNGIKIAKVGTVRIQRVSGAVGKSQLWGFAFATVTVIDSQP